MKKTFKSLTAFLFLFALLAVIQPVQPPINTNREPEISICGDDDADNTAHNAIANE